MTAAVQEPRELAALRAYIAQVRADRAARPAQLSSYEQAIAAATGLTSPEDLAEVEDVMRDGRTGLDDLTPEQFAALAVLAYARCLAIGMLLGTVTIEREAPSP
jgi:hypothetical protein